MKASKLTAAALAVPLVLSAMPQSPTVNAEPTKEQAFGVFQNPVVTEGADPWVVRHSDGYYYYTQTTGDNITVWKSKTLSGLGGAEKKVVWEPAAGAPNSQHMWAPELHFLNGKWYIYYAASDGDMGKQRMYVLESEGADPLGPYHYPQGTAYGKVSDPSDKWAIDGTILEQNGQLYMIWSGWEGDVNVSQQLYIAPMSNPWTISGNRVEISRPELAWEKNGFPYINEGPQLLKNKQGQVFLVYSASGSWTDDYCLGMLTLNGDPLNPKSWLKHEQPVFQKDPAAGVYGPGHNSFVQSPDGKEDWIVYHAARFQGAGWERNVRMQPFSWNSDGTPNFGTPVAAYAFQRVPSGEGAIGKLAPSFPGLTYKYEAESGTVNRARIVPNSDASGGAKVGYMDFEDSYVEFAVQVPPGAYTMKVRYSNGMGQQTSHKLVLNGQDLGEVTYEPYGWNSWRYAEVPVTLQAENTIRLSKGKLYTELDGIELVPQNTTVYRYEAELAELKRAKVIHDITLSNRQKVACLDEQSKLSFPVQVPKSGIYKLQFQYRNTANTAGAQQVQVNGKPSGNLSYSPTGQAWQTVSMEAELREGANTITLSKGEGIIELDYMNIAKRGE
ncbi:family 43 glycosylhydrolase [Ectobacillus ponti]|uniref:Family 43 glycosylhydrolase n=1 Tax=Ectobacillus ponti TaxID=2961894 RepID=A0AA41X899_9BACI|nr:family 43 glycosylhydrolase [Ectobacillus ponti]MCP8968190.1 family 43 glycosylhydrolase [Ectobacillus ponti]